MHSRYSRKRTLFLLTGGLLHRCYCGSHQSACPSVLTSLFSFLFFSLLSFSLFFSLFFPLFFSLFLSFSLFFSLFLPFSPFFLPFFSLFSPFFIPFLSLFSPFFLPFLSLFSTFFLPFFSLFSSFFLPFSPFVSRVGTSRTSDSQNAVRHLDVTVAAQGFTVTPAVCSTAAPEPPPVLRHQRVPRVDISADVLQAGHVALVAPSKPRLLSRAKRRELLKLASGPLSEGAAQGKRELLGLGFVACSDKALTAASRGRIWIRMHLSSQRR